MTSLPDPQRHFKFGNFIKTQFSTKTTLFITYRNKYQHLFIVKQNERLEKTW